MSQLKSPTSSRLRTLEYIHECAICEICEYPHNEGIMHVEEFDLKSYDEILESFEAVCEDCQFDMNEQVEKENAEIQSHRYR